VDSTVVLVESEGRALSQRRFGRAQRRIEYYTLNGYLRVAIARSQELTGKRKVSVDHIIKKKKKDKKTKKKNEKKKHKNPKHKKKKHKKKKRVGQEMYAPENKGSQELKEPV